MPRTVKKYQNGGKKDKTPLKGFNDIIDRPHYSAKERYDMYKNVPRSVKNRIAQKNWDELTPNELRVILADTGRKDDFWYINFDELNVGNIEKAFGFEGDEMRPNRRDKDRLDVSPYGGDGITWREILKSPEELEKAKDKYRISPDLEQMMADFMNRYDPEGVPWYSREGSPTERVFDELIRYKQSESNPYMNFLKPLGIESYEGDNKLPLQSSSVSLPKTGRKAELIYKPSRKTRTGQVPDYYRYFDSKGRPKRRPVEPEEYDRYIRENRIRKRQIIKAPTFSKGGKVKVIKKYQNGGKEPEDNLPAEGTVSGDLLRMLQQFKQPKTGKYTSANPYNDPAFMDFAKKHDLYDEGYKERGQQYFDLLYNKFGRDRIVNLLEEQIESNRPYYDLSALRGFSKSNPVPGLLPEYAEGEFTLARHFRDLAFRRDSDHPLRKEYERIQDENPDRDWSQIQNQVFEDYNPSSREIAEYIADYRGSYMPTNLDEREDTSVGGSAIGRYRHYADLIEMAKYHPDIADTFIHELQHGSESASSSLANALILSTTARNIMQEEKERLANDPENKNYDEYYHEGRGFFRNMYNYYAEPTETSARIQVLRKNLSEVGVNIFEEDVTLEDLEKLERRGTEESLGIDIGSESGSKSLDQLRSVYTDEGIIRMLNNIFKKGGRIKTIKKRKPGIKIKKFKR
jgi:hypothetical protein